jgi:DNA-binding LytR/AlgR family response regulator
MATKVVICDDIERDVEQLSEFLLAYDHSFEIIVYNSGEALIDDFLNSDEDADIVFLDIHMPGIDGVETAKMIRRKNEDIRIIFITSSKEYYQQAFEVFASNYILKPLNKDRLYTVLDRVLDEIRKDHSQKISIRYRSSIHNVDCRHILYIESQDKLITFYMSDGSNLQCYSKLDDVENELPEQTFIRCHKSFIVNAAHIDEMADNFFIVGDVKINISKNRMKSTKDKYYSYLFSRMGRGKLTC